MISRVLFREDQAQHIRLGENSLGESVLFFWRADRSADVEGAVAYPLRVRQERLDCGEFCTNRRDGGALVFEVAHVCLKVLHGDSPKILGEEVQKFRCVPLVFPGALRSLPEKPHGKNLFVSFGGCDSMFPFSGFGAFEFRQGDHLPAFLSAN